MQCTWRRSQDRTGMFYDGSDASVIPFGVFLLCGCPAFLMRVACCHTHECSYLQMLSYHLTSLQSQVLYTSFFLLTGVTVPRLQIGGTSKPPDWVAYTFCLHVLEIAIPPPTKLLGLLVDQSLLNVLSRLGVQLALLVLVVRVVVPIPS